MTYDIAVIGGGPAGYNAAEYAAGKGKRVVLFEKGNHLGGVCLNEGCIPTKAMLHSAHLLEKISNADKYGITVDGDVTADYGKIMTRKKSEETAEAAPVEETKAETPAEEETK